MIGLIVDGGGDYAAFKARYPGLVRVMKTGGARGHTVSCEALVSSARKEIAMLRAFRCKSIFIITDLEGRAETATDFIDRADKFMVGNFEYDGVGLLVCDKMIENWFLADIAYIAGIKKYIKDIKKQKVFESMHGKDELKKLFGKGFDYNEVKHSAELFPLVRGAKASAFSSSFERFRAVTGLA